MLKPQLDATEKPNDAGTFQNDTSMPQPGANETPNDMGASEIKNPTSQAGTLADGTGSDSRISEDESHKASISDGPGDEPSTDASPST